MTPPDVPTLTEAQASLLAVAVEMADDYTRHIQKFKRKVVGERLADWGFLLRHLDEHGEFVGWTITRLGRRALAAYRLAAAVRYSTTITSSES